MYKRSSGRAVAWSAWGRRLGQLTVLLLFGGFGAFAR